MDTTLVHQQAAGLDMEGCGMNKREIKRNAELAEQCMVNPSEFDYKKYAALVRADECEECAKLCEAHKLDNTLVHNNAVVGCAAAIRARSKT
jgi:hypothetical protein